MARESVKILQGKLDVESLISQLTQHWKRLIRTDLLNLDG